MENVNVIDMCEFFNEEEQRKLSEKVSEFLDTELSRNGQRLEIHFKDLYADYGLELNHAMCKVMFNLIKQMLDIHEKHVVEDIIGIDEKWSAE